jgi:hypothetical protein
MSIIEIRRRIENLLENRLRAMGLCFSTQTQAAPCGFQPGSDRLNAYSA